MPYLVEYIIDTGMAAVLHLGLDCGQDTPPPSLHVICDKRRVSPALAAIDAQVLPTPLSTKEQAPRSTQ